MKLMKTFKRREMPSDIKALWDDWAMNFGNRGYLSVWVNDDMRLEYDDTLNEYVTSKYAALAAWLIEQGAGENEHILVEYDW